ncbi:MAG: 16S rRNA (cytosine(967)-C(5))-methyltransferase, partial [Pseudoalteromonas tetraodonis]
MSNVSNVRALAAETLYNVVDKGASLNQELPFASQGLSPKDKALLQQIC